MHVGWGVYMYMHVPSTMHPQCHHTNRTLRDWVKGKITVLHKTSTLQLPIYRSFRFETNLKFCAAKFSNNNPLTALSSKIQTSVCMKISENYCYTARRETKILSI